LQHGCFNFILSFAIRYITKVVWLQSRSSMMTYWEILYDRWSKSIRKIAECFEDGHNWLNFGQIGIESNEQQRIRQRFFFGSLSQLSFFRFSATNMTCLIKSFNELIIWWDDVIDVCYRSFIDVDVKSTGKHGCLWELPSPNLGRTQKRTRRWRIMSIPQIRFQNESLLCNLLH
jgi:hypothetical protein